MDSRKTTRLLAVMFIGLLFIYGSFVIVYNAYVPGFHGFVPGMPKAVVVPLRTGLACLSIFTFFPLIWALDRRGSADSPHLLGWTCAVLALSESPAMWGLVLFLLKGAFKTFFVFFALSICYMAVAWPRFQESSKPGGSSHQPVL